MLVVTWEATKRPLSISQKFLKYILGMKKLNLLFLILLSGNCLPAQNDDVFQWKRQLDSLYQRCLYDEQAQLIVTHLDKWEKQKTWALYYHSLNQYLRTAYKRKDTTLISSLEKQIQKNIAKRLGTAHEEVAYFKILQIYQSAKVIGLEEASELLKQLQVEENSYAYPIQQYYQALLAWKKKDVKQASYFFRKVIFNYIAFQRKPDLLLSRVCHNLNVVYSEYLKQYQIAAEYGQQSLKILEDLSFTETELYMKRETYTALAFIRNKQPSISQTLLLHALSLHQDLYKKKTSKTLGSIYTHLGVLYNSKESLDSALYYGNLALETKLDFYQNTNHIEISNTYNNLGYVCFKNKDYEKALAYYQKALAIRKLLYKDYPNVAWLSNSYLNITKVFLEQKQLESAMDYCQKGIDANFLETREDAFLSSQPPLEGYIQAQRLFYSLEDKAEILCQLDALHPSLAQQKLLFQTIQLADSLLKKIKTSPSEQVDKLSLAEIGNTFYTNAVHYCWYLAQAHPQNQHEYKQTALRLAEENSAILLQQEIQRNQAINRLETPEYLNLEEKAIKSSITDWENQLITADALSKRQIEDSLFYQKRKLELVQEEMKPYFKEDSLWNIQIASLEAIQKKIPVEEAWLKYHFSKKGTFVFILTKEEFHMQKLAIDSLELVKKIGYLHQKLKDYDDVQVRYFAELSLQLYKGIFEPIEKFIQGYEQILIVGEKQLTTLPFDLLLKEELVVLNKDSVLDFTQGRYLIEDYIFNYSPSINMVARSSQPLYPQFDFDFWGFAPLFTTKDEIEENIYDLFPDRAMLDSLPEDFEPLPFSYVELDSIASLFHLKDKESRIFMEQDAKEELLKEGKINTEILHFATHTLSDLDNPAIVLHQDSVPTLSYEADDGFLFFNEILNLDIQANLVVLSSCEGGVGQMALGEGTFSLMRSFLSLGVPNVIYSMWNVNDRSTAYLMISFYENLLKGAGYLEALRQAKLDLIKISETSYPYHWGGFVGAIYQE